MAERIGEKNIKIKKKIFMIKNKDSIKEKIERDQETDLEAMKEMIMIMNMIIKTILCNKKDFIHLREDMEDP